MYAITTNGFRAIQTATDATEGETVVDELPVDLLVRIACSEQRAQRDALLRACDWTQVPDVPLDEATRTAWVAYRQALRDVPSQAGFPAAITWPTAPGN